MLRLFTLCRLCVVAGCWCLTACQARGYVIAVLCCIKVKTHHPIAIAQKSRVRMLLHFLRGPNKGLIILTIVTTISSVGRRLLFCSVRDQFSSCAFLTSEVWINDLGLPWHHLLGKRWRMCLAYIHPNQSLVADINPVAKQLFRYKFTLAWRIF